MWVLVHVHFLLAVEVKVDPAAVDGSLCLLVAVVEEEAVAEEEEDNSGASQQQQSSRAHVARAPWDRVHGVAPSARCHPHHHRRRRQQSRRRHGWSYLYN